MVIHGTAYGRGAMLEIAGDTLRWRAHRGLTPIAENIVTTVHEVKLARWSVQRHSWAGLALGVIGAVWLARAGMIVGVTAIALAAALVVRRLWSPRRVLVLELGATQLAMTVAASSASAARQLAARIDHAIATGEAPASPPMLP